MTLKEKVAKVMPERVGEEFYGGVKYCPTTYIFLKGHYDAKAKERCFKYKCDRYKCEKCWNMEYIEDYVTDTNVGNESDNVNQEKLMSNNSSTTAVNIDAFYNGLPVSELKVYSELLKRRINAQQEIIQIQEEYMRILLARLREDGMNG